MERAHATTCGSALALEHNGGLYSCDDYVEEDDRFLTTPDCEPGLHYLCAGYQTTTSTAHQRETTR